MNQYKVTITFNDGDQVHSKVAAENQSEALARLMGNEQVKEFAVQHEEVKSVGVEYIGEYVEVQDDPLRFSLTPSQEREGWWVAADRRTKMVFIFMEGVFPDSVECRPLEDMPPLDAATAVRELGDWLKRYHGGLLEERGDATKYVNRKRIGTMMAEARRRQGLTVRELAERSGVSYQNITKIENGRYNVSIDILGKLCKALDLKIDLCGA